MREKSSIKFEIPVPWAASPACIEARGIHAVIAASIITVIILALIVLD